MFELVDLLLLFSAKLGYLGIVFLMMVESSFIPFPSEIIIPPAAYLAQQGEMNIFLVIASGILGGLLGAIINYFLALSLGRKIIYSLANTRLAKLLLINEKKVKFAENNFLKYGNFSTFFGRLVPALRQLISIPAGFSRMNFKNFLFYTFLGSGLWTIILALLGYLFGSNQELLAKYYKEISWFFLLVATAIIIFLFIKIKFKKTAGKN
ncbi:MAG: DedA family protein [Patescibacteria group bacterium]|nr:DedA family protein [Patescibacteria group bacterium]